MLTAITESVGLTVDRAVTYKYSFKTEQYGRLAAKKSGKYGNVSTVCASPVWFWLLCWLFSRFANNECLTSSVTLFPLLVWHMDLHRAAYLMITELWAMICHSSSFFFTFALHIFGVVRMSEGCEQLCNPVVHRQLSHQDRRTWIAMLFFSHDLHPMSLSISIQTALISIRQKDTVPTVIPLFEPDINCRYMCSINRFVIVSFLKITPDSMSILKISGWQRPYSNSSRHFIQQRYWKTFRSRWSENYHLTHTFQVGRLKFPACNITQYSVQMVYSATFVIIAFA